MEIQMKSTKYLIIMFSIALALNVHANLVQNGDFEKKMSRWDDEAARVKPDPHNKTNLVCFATIKKSGYVCQKIDVKNPGKIIITFKAMKTEDAPDDAGVSYSLVGPGFAIGRTPKKFSSTNTWEQFKFEYNLSEEHVSKASNGEVTIYIRASSEARRQSGYIVFDDIVVKVE
jgi:hypothetical protein